MAYKAKAYIPCCDESLPIIKVGSYLFDKFWPELEVNYIGFKKPEYDFYNKNHSFHSMAPIQEGGASKWTRYIHDFMKDIDDEYLLFLIDDYWLCKEPEINMIDTCYKIMKENNVGRFDLTFDAQVEREVQNIPGYEELGIGIRNPMSPYRISTQPSVWEKEYLLDILNHDWSPWEFELRGTDYAKIRYPNEKQTFAFYDEEMKTYPVRTIAKGAVSRHSPGKYNVLGMSFTTIKELIDVDFLKEENLIWGQWNGKIPSFNELGGYDFDPKKMPIHETSKTNWKEYEHIYNPSKEVVNLFDNSFSHTKQLWGYIAANGTDIWGKPEKIEYVKNSFSENISLFVNNLIDNSDAINSCKSKYKIGWIIEPRDITITPYVGVEKNHELFDLIITFDKELIQNYSNCKHLVWCESRVRDEDWGKWDIDKKHKLLSMIISNKTISEGHRFRFNIASHIKDRHEVDFWGNAFKSFNEKTEPLGSYLFSIVANNSVQDSFFTEALCDCFALKTIPIFRGCKNIGDFFDTRGIIQFDTLDELDNILSSISEEMYVEKLQAIENNFNIAQKFRRVVDDQICSLIKQELKI